MSSKYSERNVIGDAPRYYVHVACKRGDETELCKFAGRHRCKHCKQELKSGIVVSAPAKLPHRMRKRGENDSPEGPSAA